MFVSHAPWICQPLIRPPWHGGALSNGAESTEEREARLHQLSVTQRQRIAAESTEEREARLQQLRILLNRNNHQDLLINCHSKYIPILLVLIDVFHYAIIEACYFIKHQMCIIVYVQ